VFVLAATSCGPTSSSVFGPTTLQALDSADEATVLAALVRIHIGDPAYPALGAKAQQLFRDARHLLVVRVLALLSSVGGRDELMALLDRHDLSPELVAAVAYYLGANREKLDLRADAIRAKLVDSHIEPIVRYALVMGARASGARDDAIEDMMFELAVQPEQPTQRALPMVLRVTILDGISSRAPHDTQIPRLLALLKDSSAELRIAAAAALKSTESNPPDPRIVAALVAVALEPGVPDDLFATAIQALRETPPPNVVKKTLETYLSATTIAPVRRICAWRLALWKTWDDRLVAPVLDALLAGEDFESNAGMLAGAAASPAAITSAITQRQGAIRSALRHPRWDSVGGQVLRLLAGWSANLQLQPTIAIFRGDLLAVIASHDWNELGSAKINEAESDVGDALDLAMGTYLQVAGAEGPEALRARADDTRIDANVRARLLFYLHRHAPGVLSGKYLMAKLGVDQPDPVRVAAIIGLATDKPMPDRDPLPLIQLALSPGESPNVQSAAIATLATLGYHDRIYLLRLLGRLDGQACLANGFLEGPSAASLDAIGAAELDAIDVLKPLALRIADEATARCRQQLENAFRQVATNAADNDRVWALPILVDALDIVPEGAWSIADRAPVSQAIHQLENARDAKASWPVFAFAREHVVPTLVAAYIILALGVAFVLLTWWPLTLPAMSQGFEKLDLEIPIAKKVLPLGTVVASTLTIVTLFRNHRRVLDAWVDAQRDQVTQRFNEIPSVLARAPHVLAPAAINRSSVDQLDRATIAVHARARRTVLVIDGDGGAGKSSLAFQIARWSLATDADGLFPWRALPVLIDYDLPAPGEKSTARAVLLGEVRKQLRELVGGALPPDGFVEKLVERRRILIVVDRVSELSAETTARLVEGLQALADLAVVVTTRSGDKLAALRPVVIRPETLHGPALSKFVAGYLRVRQEQKPDDVAIAATLPIANEVSADLERLAGTRGITALLATIYLDDRLDTATKAPTQIAELFARYIDRIHGPAEHSYTRDQTHAMLRMVAQLCIDPSHPLRPASVTDVEAALGEHGSAKLAFLRDTLRLVQVGGIGRDELRFTLDPLAEQLSAHQVFSKATKGDDRWEPARWEPVLRELKATLAKHATLRSYIAALLDYIGADPKADAVRGQLQLMIAPA
jgi:hypothetical protein